MRDAGILTMYSLQNTATAGLMPAEKLVSVGTAYYDEKTVGVTRAYSAMAANQQIDMLVRCYNTEIPIAAEYVILEDGLQYRISLKQLAGDHVDLTLERLEEMLDVYDDEGEDSEDTDSPDPDPEP